MTTQVIKNNKKQITPLRFVDVWTIFALPGILMLLMLLFGFISLDEMSTYLYPSLEFTFSCLWNLIIGFILGLALVCGLFWLSITLMLPLIKQIQKEIKE